MNKPLIAALVTTAALVSPQLVQANPAAKKAQVCTLCHRPGGIGPLLEAQPARFLAAATAEYKAGKRISPAMQPNVANLSARDITDISTYFAALPLPPHGQPIDPAKAEAGRAQAKELGCASCHGDGYAGRDAVPRLAGQQPVYLRYALEEQAGNRRPHPVPVLTDTSAIENVAQYLAGLK